MITKAQYEAAKQVTDQYKHQNVTKSIKNLKCICCQRPIVPVEGYLPLDRRLEKGAWEDGTVTLVSFGYGSRMHDFTSYFIALCDTGMQHAKEQGISLEDEEVAGMIR